MPAAAASANVLKIAPGELSRADEPAGPLESDRPKIARRHGPSGVEPPHGRSNMERPHDRSEIGQRAWRGFLRAHASLAKRLEAELEGTHGLPLSSYDVLQRLMDAPGARMRMCDLADQVQLSRSGLTRLVDRLEREQLLSRCSCEHDARGAYACLTEHGRERLCAARETHREVVREHFLSRFSQPELRALAEMWDRIAPGCCA